MTDRPKILWGITGSVAAIRAGQLAEQLRELGDVQAVVTRRARHFLDRASLSPPSTPGGSEGDSAHQSSGALENMRMHDDDAEWSSWEKLGDLVLHIELRRWADVFVIAPATADSIAKISCGICDSLLLSVARAWDYAKPLVIAPAMNTLMWEHPTTAEHLERLAKWGACVVPPVEKELACADVGMGAQASADSIKDEVERVWDAFRRKRSNEK